MTANPNWPSVHVLRKPMHNTLANADIHTCISLFSKVYEFVMIKLSEHTQFSML